MPEFTDSLRSGTYCAAVPRPAERPLLSKLRERKAGEGNTPAGVAHALRSSEPTAWVENREKLNFYDRAAWCPGGKVSDEERPVKAELDSHPGT